MPLATRISLRRGDLAQQSRQPKVSAVRRGPPVPAPSGNSSEASVDGGECRASGRRGIVPLCVDDVGACVLIAVFIAMAVLA